MLRLSGAIVGGSSPSDTTITAPPLIKALASLQSNPKIKGVVLVVNSPGGDALASDLVWRAVARLAAVDFDTLCFSHFDAVGREGRAELRALAARVAA